MKITFITHHLIQAGDAYGLIYSLLLNRNNIGADQRILYALFFIDENRFRLDESYKKQVKRRIHYFKSFDLWRKRVIPVFCAKSSGSIFLCNILAGNDTAGLPHITLTAGSLFCRGKLNTRLVSLVLTGVENDPRKDIDRIKSSHDSLGWSDEFDACRKKLRNSLQMACKFNLQLLGKKSEIADIGFSYISVSTKYIRSCVKGGGYVNVSQCLRANLLSSTDIYKKDNERFIQKFMVDLKAHYLSKTAEHYVWHNKKVQVESNEFIIVLFWIRGARRDEYNAILKRGGNNMGKPQHHTNMTLYKYTRYIVSKVAKNMKLPFLFVPIGDELKDILSGDMAGYQKRFKNYNLIRFFEKPPFAGKPMGAQMDFLLRLSQKYKVIQIGMRSGAMERLMYLGVPTIYFDRTNEVNGLPVPVGAERIKQLCSFDGNSTVDLLKYVSDFLCSIKRVQKKPLSGFPLFFQLENMDTGFFRYLSLKNSSAVNRANQLSTLLGVHPLYMEEFKLKVVRHKNYIRNNFLKAERFVKAGGLSEREGDKLTIMLWFIATAYSDYNESIKCGTVKSQLTTLGNNQYSNLFIDNQKELVIEELRQVHERQEKKQRKEEGVDYEGMGSMFGGGDDDD